MTADEKRPTPQEIAAASETLDAIAQCPTSHPEYRDADVATLRAALDALTREPGLLARVGELEAKVKEHEDAVEHDTNWVGDLLGRVDELEATVARVQAVVERHRGGSHEAQSPLVYEIDAALAGPPQGRGTGEDGAEKKASTAGRPGRTLEQLGDGEGWCGPPKGGDQ